MYNDTLLFELETEECLGMEFIHVISDCEYLHKQRIAMGLSQQAVADAAKINIRQYQRLESGERAMSSTSLRIGLAICDALKLDPHRFVPEVEK